MSRYMDNTLSKRNRTWWRKRSSLERGLTFIVIVTGFVCIALVFALGVVTVYCSSYNFLNQKDTSSVQEGPGLDGQSSKLQGGEESIVCTTPECIHTASRVLKYIDFNVEPCDDFYKFVCGGFLKSTNIPDDKTNVNTFSIIRDELQEHLRADIEEEVKENEPKPFKLAKTLYKSCMNKTLIEQQGIKPLKTILQKLGGWPAVEGDQWVENNFNWIKTLYKMKELGYTSNVFMEFFVDVDPINKTQHILMLDAPRVWVTPEVYYNYTVDVAEMLGANKSLAEEELRKALDFQIKLVNISKSKADARNVTLFYTPMTIKELSSRYEFVPWKEYFNTLLPKSVQVDEDELIGVVVPYYFHDLDHLLNTTPKRVQANYMLWGVASASVPHLNDEIHEKRWQSTLIDAMTEGRSRWNDCANVVSNFMYISVDAMYVRNHFDGSTKKHVLELVTNVREQFRKILKNADWMDDKTRTYALEKINSMATHIAYPDELLDDRKLEEYYAGLELSEGNYFENILNLTRFQSERPFRMLTKPVNHSEWTTFSLSAVVNAFYSTAFNSILLPAGILQGVFFNNERPRYMNYGAIGSTIGHEITHGFDEVGRQYDKNGNLVNWWASGSEEIYLRKVKCMIDQYENYTAKEVGMKVNGSITKNENIADNGGIKAAYFAYDEWMQRSIHPEPQLPGLAYTARQMFWISAAHTWCTKYRPESLQLRSTVSFHSPGEFRVLGPFSNMEEFARDFECPLGTKMNPVKKCSVW